MSGGSSKIYIKIESEAEQLDTIRHSKKSLKILQKTADKENLTGRDCTPLSIKDRLNRENTESEYKRKIIKCSTRSTQTEEKNKKQITAADLTSEESPSEAYWERLAEKRREALEISLKENELLHNKVESLEDELNTSRKMVEEARNLVEVLQEMLQESGALNESVDDIVSDQEDNYEL